MPEMCRYISGAVQATDFYMAIDSDALLAAKGVGLVAPDANWATVAETVTPEPGVRSLYPPRATKRMPSPPSSDARRSPRRFVLDAVALRPYLIATALAGEPAPPVMFRGAATKRPSRTLFVAQSAASASNENSSPTASPRNVTRR